MEYENNQNTRNNLNGKENLIVVDYVPTVIDLQCSVNQWIIYPTRQQVLQLKDLRVDQ